MNNEKINELKSKIAVEKEGLIKARLFLELTFKIQNTDLPQAIYYTQEAVRLLKQPDYENSPHPRELAESVVHLGKLEVLNGNYAQAIKLIFEAIPFLENFEDQKLYARGLNIIAAGNSFLSNHYESMKYYLKSLRIFKQLGDKQWEAGVLNNIALQHRDLENYEWALEYLHKSLESFKNLADMEGLGNIYETLCRTYFYNNQPDEALKYGEKSLALYQEINILHGEAEALTSLGNVHAALKHYDQAQTHYQKALEITQKIGHRQGEAETLLRIGHLQTLTGQADIALQTLFKALKISETLDLKKTIYESYEYISKAYKKQLDFEKALNYFEKFFKLYREVFDTNENNRVEALAIMHQLETVQKDAEIYRLKNVALQNEIQERKKIQARLQKLAITDPLTGLYNRRYIFKLANEEFQHSKLDQQEFAAILIDIDNFKKINDRYGHSAGDEVLIRLAECMRDALRKQDTLARYGGEEFVALLPQTSAVEAKLVAERLRKMISELTILYKGQEIHTNVSVGIAQFNTLQINNIENIFNRADLTMYAAKQAGGNRVYIWEEGQETPSPIFN